MNLLVVLAACKDPGNETDVSPAETGDGPAGAEGRDAPLPTPARPHYDVLVVGGGPAGLAAAADAFSAGARVRVLEREDSLGGSANWAGGLMMFSGTPRQEELAITDSPELLLGEWETFTGGDADDPWVAFFAHNNVGMVHEWLAGMGVEWSDPQGDPSSGATRRIHTVVNGGAGLVDALADQVPASVVQFGAQAEDLVHDADGRVVGVEWTDLADGSTRTLYADTVIVATGGFMHDLERVREVRPDLAGVELSWGSWPGADGNGLELLEAHGAAVENLDAVGLYAHGAPGLEDENELAVSFIADLPWVNAEGRRFVDESTTNSFQTGAVRAAQPDGLAWMIFDDAMAAGADFRVNVPEGEVYAMEELVDAGHALVADDLDGLATSLGVDGDALEAEIDAWNAARDGAVQDPWRSTMARSAPVLTAPYYALPVAVTVAKGFGGVDTDLQGRVLDADGQPIPGLYAAGELTGMLGGSLVGDYGFTGSLTAVVLGGRVAGQNAAAEALE